MFARIPSVVSSTIGGDFFGEGKYLEGIILFAVTGAISIIGIIIYNKLLKKYHERKAKKDEAYGSYCKGQYNKTWKHP